ncbi:two-component sensor histidine kinase [Nocardia transvalensis]|uniref:Two-component sensor histidine kinase n=1 Tax=Nocardia transvalensis TaxID=37333 RepID=A0A7W9UJ74_9NOCA|nr:ATP-binding protein [Nocardia transvalensis]MBB5915184.1 two-component sensor histidine kinase [Nocardia transvalensis]
MDLDAVTLAQLRSTLQHLLHDSDVEPGLSAEDAVQVTDELVTNALRHGLPPRTCAVTLSHGPRLRVEVSDTSPEAPRFRAPDDTGGLGLVLVDQMSTAWGIDRHPGGKTVWAELTSSPDEH